MVTEITRWQLNLQTVLDSWKGTPWIAGQRLRGVGADCVNFWASVMDELHGQDPRPVPRVSQHLGYHSGPGAFSVMRSLVSRYPLAFIPLDTPIEPGDTLIERRGDGPGHVLIAGANPIQLWHCINGGGVCYTGRAMVKKYLIHILRSTERESWRTR